MSAPDQRPEWIADELASLDRVLPALRALQDADKAADDALTARMKAHHAAWTDSYGEQAQREAFEGALDDDAIQIRAHRAGRRAREIPLSTPYFARLVLRENKRADQEVLLGKVGVVESGLAIVDWRNAPISRMYYEYDEGDEYAEEFNGREREGVVSARRRVDIRDSVLVEAQRGDETLRRLPDGDFVSPDEANARAPRQDHRLPDIVSLITREQFAVITRPEAGVVLLRGRAGSGKTTVALHRVAYLHFQDAERFKPSRVLVVMFNKALQTYISRVLPELGVAGVSVETFHGWAGRVLRNGGISLGFRAGVGAELARLKRHPAVAELMNASLARLGTRSADWLVERLPPTLAELWSTLPGEGLARVAALRRAAKERGLGSTVEPLWTRLRNRLVDHPRDLWALWEDDALATGILPSNLHRVLPAAREAAVASQAAGMLAYEDAALLLRIGQRKAALDPSLAPPWMGCYSHVVIDEAQDLSTLEISALVEACDGGRSVTIAGDPAQKILADAQFEGFEALLEKLGGAGRTQIRLDALAVGHRSTRPIMALALRALDAPMTDPILAGSRDGVPVEWVPLGEDGGLSAVVAAVGALRAAKPMSLVAVLCKRKEVADRWARALAEAGCADVRRADRGDFQFHPGVVVSNVHQVKGLEFDGVVLVDPADYGARDRHLLHVAITRAADRLWVVAPRGPGLLRD